MAINALISATIRVIGAYIAANTLTKIFPAVLRCLKVSKGCFQRLEKKLEIFFHPLSRNPMVALQETSMNRAIDFQLKTIIATIKITPAATAAIVPPDAMMAAIKGPIKTAAKTPTPTLIAISPASIAFAISGCALKNSVAL